MMYLKGLFNIPSYLLQKGFRKDETVHRMFDLDWDIANNEQNVIYEENRQKRKSIMIEQSKREQFVSKVSEPPSGSFTKKKTAEESKSASPVKLKISPEKKQQLKKKTVVEVPKAVDVVVEKPSNIEKLHEETRKE